MDDYPAGTRSLKATCEQSVVVIVKVKIFVAHTKPHLFVESSHESCEVSESMEDLPF
jgi:hypothetical protein